VSDAGVVKTWNDLPTGTFAEIGTNIGERMSVALGVGGQMFKPNNFEIKSKNRKWRVSSAMQKAIRRGDVETAQIMAEGLYSFDPEYCWRRLPIIVVEDIGVANPILVAGVLWCSGKKQWMIKAAGSELAALHTIVEMMCRSVKDRSVCDLLVWVDEEPDWQERRAGMSSTQYVGVSVSTFCDTGVFLADRMLAGWEIAGTVKCPGGHVPEGLVGDFNEVLNAAHHLGLPPICHFIMKTAINKLGDAMPVAYPLIWEMVADTIYDKINPFEPKKLTWKADDLIQLPKIGYYPSEAFDWHCFEGKKAMRMFIKNCPPIAKFCRDDCGLDLEGDPKELIRPIGSLLFWVEGAQLDRRLEFEGSKDLQDLAELACNRSYLVPGHMNDWAMQLMRSNMDVMHWARMKVLDAIPPGVTVIMPVGVTPVLGAFGLIDALDVKIGDMADILEQGLQSLQTTANPVPDIGPAHPGSGWELVTPSGVVQWYPSKEAAEEAVAQAKAKMLGSLYDQATADAAKLTPAEAKAGLIEILGGVPKKKMTLKIPVKKPLLFTWVCGVCDTENKDGVKTCPTCGASSDE
jgi:hypothetical protein